MTDTPNAAATSVSLSGDAHGQAALLLVESLLHGLIAHSALTVKQAIEIVEIAADVKQDHVDAAESPAASATEALRLLNAIGASLVHDLPRK